jgi:hypothetical protein
MDAEDVEDCVSTALVSDEKLARTSLHGVSVFRRMVVDEAQKIKTELT